MFLSSFFKNAINNSDANIHVPTNAVLRIVKIHASLHMISMQITTETECSFIFLVVFFFLFSMHIARQVFVFSYSWRKCWKLSTQFCGDVDCWWNSIAACINLHSLHSLPSLKWMSPFKRTKIKHTCAKKLFIDVLNEVLFIAFWIIRMFNALSLCRWFYLFVCSLVFAFALVYYHLIWKDF